LSEHDERGFALVKEVGGMERHLRGSAHQRHKGISTHKGIRCFQEGAGFAEEPQESDKDYSDEDEFGDSRGGSFQKRKVFGIQYSVIGLSVLFPKKKIRDYSLNPCHLCSEKLERG
jgi:hypothetical protein